METKNIKIDNLLKVALILEAGTSRDNFNLLAEPEKMEFVDGVAACGITPFEKLLYLKTAGDELITAVDLKKPGEFFGPLPPDMPDRLQGRGEIFIKVKINSVRRPEDREVIKALASGGGCGGDCGCGCG
jgi:hypothetical protein